jgi:hypothetical protein
MDRKLRDVEVLPNHASQILLGVGTPEECDEVLMAEELQG